MDRELYGSRRGRSGSYGATDRDSYADTNSHAYAYAYTYTYTYTYSDAYSRAHRHSDA